LFKNNRVCHGHSTIGIRNNGLIVHD
jgi:hypothetical protein